MYGTVAYVPQNPWYAQTTSFIRVFAHYVPKIMGGKAKDNILFSHQYDNTFYDLVLDGEYLLPQKAS